MNLRLGSNLADPFHTAQHARLSEKLDFDFVGAGEHVFRDKRPGSTQIALSALATASGATSRVRLLSSIVIAPLHHPVMLAKEAAVVDAASCGRLTLGVGVGGEFKTEFDALDIPHKQRGERTNETLEILSKLWNEKDVSHDGHFFSFRGLTIYPAPLQKPGPPVWVGGRSELAMRRAVKYGDGWIPYLYRPSHYQRSVEIIGNMLTSNGLEPQAFGWGLHLMTVVGDSRDEARTIAAKGLRKGYLYDGDYERLADRYCLLGPPDECVEQLREYHDAGAQDILLSWVTPNDQITSQITAIGQEVIPVLGAPS